MIRRQTTSAACDGTRDRRAIVLYSNDRSGEARQGPCV